MPYLHGKPLPVWCTMLIVVETTWKMTHKNIERIARNYPAGHKKHVARELAGKSREVRANDFRGNGFERQRFVKQSHVNAPLVRAAGHDISVAHSPQHAALGQFFKNRIVLHFAECHDVGSRYSSCGSYSLAHVFQFVSELAPCPPTRSRRKKIIVLFHRIVNRIKQIFHVPLHDAKAVLRHNRSQCESRKQDRHDNISHCGKFHILAVCTAKLSFFTFRQKA